MTFDRLDLERLNVLFERAYGGGRDAGGSRRQPPPGRDRAPARHRRQPGSFDTATRISRWESLQGYRSTFYVLHTASYWVDEPFFRAELEHIALAGHEIGIHANAITVALVTGQDPHEILWGAIDQLRDWGHTGHRGRTARRQPLPGGGVRERRAVRSSARDRRWATPTGTCSTGDTRLKLEPLPLAQFGLRYETYRLPKGEYLSDTGGQWNLDLDAGRRQGPVARLAASGLVGGAFVGERVAA